MQTKGADKKTFYLRILMFFIVLLGLVGGAIYHLKTKDLRALKLVTYANGEQRLCWDGGCGWAMVPPAATLAKYPNSPSAVPSIVSGDVSQPKQSEITLIRYKEFANETYSPLKAAVVGKKFVYFTIKQDDTFALYQYDLQKQSRVLVTQTDTTEGAIPYAVSIQPENEDVALVAMYSKTEVKFALLTSSGLSQNAAKIVDFTWQPNQYTVTTQASDGPISRSCSFEVDIVDCINSNLSE